MTNNLHIDSTGTAHWDPSCEEFRGMNLGVIPEGSPALQGALHCADCED